MTVKVKVPNDKTVKMEVRVPRGIPTENGAFQSAAGENGQEFNIMGEVKTERYNSPISRNWRSCSFPIRERECHNEPVTECGVNAHGEKICKTRLVPVCRDVIRYIPGHEVYDGYTATKNEYMRANLLEPSTNALLGTLSTGDSDSHFVETWSSGCIMGPHYP